MIASSVDLHPVEGLVAVAQTGQDSHGLLDDGSPTMIGWKRRSRAASFSTCWRYSSSVVAPMHVQLAARQRRLEHVGGVHRALARAGADHGVQLVDEQQQVVAVVAHVLHQVRHPLLELAAVAAAGEHAREVERDQPPAGEQVRHVVVDEDWAIPSTIAVLPTPGSPMSTGLFLVRRDRTSSVCSISCHDRRRGRAGPRVPRGEVAAVLVERRCGAVPTTTTTTRRRPRSTTPANASAMVSAVRPSRRSTSPVSDSGSVARAKTRCSGPTWARRSPGRTGTSAGAAACTQASVAVPCLRRPGCRPLPAPAVATAPIDVDAHAVGHRADPVGQQRRCHVGHVDVVAGGRRRLRRPFEQPAQVTAEGARDVDLPDGLGRGRLHRGVVRFRHSQHLGDEGVQHPRPTSLRHQPALGEAGAAEPLQAGRSASVDMADVASARRTPQRSHRGGSGGVTGAPGSRLAPDGAADPHVPATDRRPPGRGHDDRMLARSRVP